MTQDAMQKRPLSEWQTQTIRCTTFFRPQAEAMPISALRSLWKDIANDEPEKVIEKPKEPSATATGLFGDGRLMLTSRPSGSDLRLVPAEETVGARATPSLGGFERLCTEFTPLARKLLTAGVPGGVNRVAFGAVIYFPVSNMVEANRRLAPYLHGIITDPENLHDLVYRCNRRRNSSILGRNEYVNRVSTWTTALFQMVRTVVSEEGLSPQVAKTVLVAQLELDINTPAERVDPLPSGKLADIFGELMDMGQEIAREGDIS